MPKGTHNLSIKQVCDLQKQSGIAIFAVFIMRKLFVIAAFLAFAVPATAQHTDGHDDHSHELQEGQFSGLREVMAATQGEGDAVSHSFVGIVPRVGLALQKGLFAEAGVSLDFYRLGYIGASEYVTFNYRNLRPYVSGEILVSGRKLLGGGKAGLEFIMSSPVLGMAFGADASYYSDGRDDAITITPRLMLSLVYVEVFYGYNFFVHNDLRPWIGHHRIGVSTTINGRFWKRKKQIYEEYYNSYL
jgi:hypothetical protein